MHILNLGELENAVSFYTKAARRRTNEFTSPPIYWMKAGMFMRNLKNTTRHLRPMRISRRIILKALKAGRLKNTLPG
jgi:hypothetical protein